LLKVISSALLALSQAHLLRSSSLFTLISTPSLSTPLPRERVPALLDKLRLSYTSLAVHGTPRRLAVLVKDLSPSQTPQESRLRGPPAKAAFDSEGKPTKALEGFCKKNGVEVGDVTKEADAKGVEYCYVTVKDAGRPAAEVSGGGGGALVDSRGGM
jgi:glycyl-tRNA synthetase